jgi:preprotein translocase subunit SecD
MGLPSASAMITAAPVPSTLSRLIAVLLLAAGCPALAGEDKAAKQPSAETKPSAAVPAPPAPSKDLAKAGGAWFLVQVGATGGKAVDKTALREVDVALFRRLSVNKTIPVSIVPQGPDLLYVEVWGMKPEAVEATKAAIIKPGKLAFHLLGPEGLGGKPTADDKSEKPGLVKMRFHDDGDEGAAKGDQRVWVNREASVAGKVKHATADQYPGDINYMINVELRPEAGAKMKEVTTANTGQPLAIVVDEEVISAPIILHPFGANFQITGNYTEATARSLATQLVNPLDHPVTIVQSGTVPPAPVKKP